MPPANDLFAYREKAARRPAQMRARRVRSQIEEPGRVHVFARLIGETAKLSTLELVSGADPYNNC